MLQGYIFDMDGTLLDSLHVWDAVPELYMKQKGISPKEDMGKVFAVLSLTQIAVYFQEHYGITDDIPKIISEINAHVEKEYKYKVPLKEGVYEYVWKLYHQKKEICLLTACDLDLAKAALRRCGILPAFTKLMSCESLGYSKQEPILYHKAIENMASKREECVFIEDSLYAIKTIKEAGYQVYAVYDEANDADWNMIGAYSDATFLKISEIKI